MTTSLRETPPTAALLSFGPGAALGLAGVAVGLHDGRRPLLVVGSGTPRRPWFRRVRATLPPHVLVTVPGSYPTRDSVGRVTRLILDAGTGAVVAIGGGSVLDTAKAAAAGARRLGAGECPVTAVPTTPGSGAEATPFAAVWDFDAGRKESYQEEGLTPRAVVLDPELTRTLSARALGGMVCDTLAQGMEGAWSTGSTPDAEAHGIGAVGMAATALERVLADPDDLAARGALSLAGYFSGRAIATARTTLCHALSYPLTLRYGVPHGHACGMTLAAVLRFNSEVDDADCLHPLGAAHVRRVVDRLVGALGCTTVDEAGERLTDLMAAAGLPGYRAGGYDDALVAADAARYDRAGNNPRRPEHQQLTSLLASAR